MVIEFLKSIVLVFVLSFSAQAFAKKMDNSMEKEKLTSLGLSNVVIKGKFRKHDKKFIYLS